MDNIAEYKEYLFLKELSKGTIDIYLREAQKLRAFLDGRKITKGEVIRYKGILTEKSGRMTTRNLQIVAVNSYLKFLGYENCCVKTEKIQKRHSLSNVLNGDEVQKMLLAARRTGKEKYYYIMRTLSHTGMRVGELAFLTAEALEPGRFMVDNKGKTREIYLPACLVEELQNYCKASGIRAGAIFLGYKGRPINRTSIYKAFIDLAEEAGVPRAKAHPHSFRHLFAVTYMRQYGNLAELADILGHSNLETTRIYTVTSAEEKRERLNELRF